MPPMTPADEPDRRREPRSQPGGIRGRHAHQVEHDEAQHEGAEDQRHRARREHHEQLRADDRAQHGEHQQRHEPARRVADRALPAQLETVHHEVRDDQERHGGLHVDDERQERRAQRGEPEADRALDEGGDEDGGGRGERLARERLAQDLGRVLGPATGQVLDLLAARDPGRDDLGLRRRGLHGRRQAAVAERDRDVVVLALEAERARHAAAAGVDLAAPRSPPSGAPPTVGAVPTSAFW